MKIIKAVKSFFAKIFSKQKKIEGNISPSKNYTKSSPKIKRSIRPLTEEDISALRTEMMAVDWKVSEIDLLTAKRPSGIDITKKEG